MTPPLPEVTLKQAQDKFYFTLAPIAFDVAPKIGFPAAIIPVQLAIAYIETAERDPIDGLYKPGLSVLYTEANNPFGMQWFASVHGPGSPHPDPLPPFQVESSEFVNGVRVPKVELFRHFESLTLALTANGLLLLSPHYQPARAAIEKQGWQGFALCLGPKTAAVPDGCGYSTSPRYGAQLIVRVKESYLDDPRLLGWYATGKDPGRQKDSGQWRVDSGQTATEAIADPEIGQ